MTYFLGVDGGGSKTYALVTDEQGRVLGKGKGGNGNHQGNRDEAERNIRKAAMEALHSACVALKEIEFACFGLAGADREADFRILRPMIGSLGFARQNIVCDTIIGMRAGTEHPYGVVVICGSGTNCAGVNKRGEVFQCGGFSYMYGDFGGGYGLAAEAFRTVIRAWDGREPATLLTGLVLEQLGYPSVERMHNDFLDHDKSVPPDLATTLFTAANQGDDAAIRILRMQGEELGKSAAAVIRRLGMQEENFDVVLAGSILTRGAGGVVNRYIEQSVKQSAPAAQVKKLCVEPVVGAAWLAMEAAGYSISQDVYERMSGYGDFESDIGIAEMEEGTL